MELKQIDLNANQFQANGKTYVVKDSLSVERYRWFEKYQIDFGLGRSFKSVADTLKKSRELFNKGKTVEALYLNYNLEMAIAQGLEKRTNDAMMLCALFIVTEDEDLTKWDEQEQMKKIDDWNSEGYEVNSFFRLAANLVPGFIENLEEILSDTSELAKAIEGLKQLSGTTQQD